MKYFTQDNISSGKWARDFRAYHKQLDKLQGRISRQAWNFFALGFGGWGLHDATLLSLSVGDGLDHPLDGSRPFNFDKEKTKVRLLILNRKQTMLYSFLCSKIRKVAFNYPRQNPRWDGHRIEHLDRYELTSADKKHLRLEILFSSQVKVLVEFGQLKFRRQLVKRA